MVNSSTYFVFLKVDLPSKTVKEYEIKLSADERKIYEKIYAQSK